MESILSIIFLIIYKTIYYFFLKKKFLANSLHYKCCHANLYPWLLFFFGYSIYFFFLRERNECRGYNNFFRATSKKQSGAGKWSHFFVEFFADLTTLRTFFFLQRNFRTPSTRLFFYFTTTSFLVHIYTHIIDRSNGQTKNIQG